MEITICAIPIQHNNTTISSHDQLLNIQKCLIAENYSCSNGYCVYSGYTNCNWEVSLVICIFIGDYLCDRVCFYSITTNDQQ